MMAKKFFDLEETAEMLGVSTEELNEMRARNEIRGYRDGPTWKFKFEDVDRVAQILREKSASESGVGSDDALGGDVPSEEEGSVLLSERELGPAAGGSPSTIIGETPKRGGDEDDLSLADSDIGLGSDAPSAGSPDDAVQQSDVRLAGGSDVLGGGEPASELGLQFEELDSLELDFDGATDSTAPPAKKNEPVIAGDDLSLGGESDLSLEVDEDATETEDSIDLGGDDDLVLGGSSSGSDVTVRPGESGISLMDPSDSGLSLEEVPLELGGSSVVSNDSLILDDEETLTLGDGTDPSSISSVSTDAQRPFDLTVEEEPEDASESGSQVIALGEEEGFDPEAATMIGGAFAAAPEMLEAEAESDQQDELDLGVAPQPMSAGFVSPALPEAPYSIWNVLSLTVCILILGLCGIMMFDMVRNIWSWDQAYPVNSTLMTEIINIFSGK